MATLIIKRDNAFMNGLRDYKVKLDDVVFAIGNDEQKIVDVRLGSHSVQARIDWCGSAKYDFNVEDDEATVTLVIKNYYASRFIIFISLMCIVMILLPPWIVKTYLWACVTSLSLLALFIYITVLKEKYLKIERV